LGTFEGRAAVCGFFEDWLSAYEEFEVVVEEIADLGNGVTYAVLSQKGRPVGSSGEVRVRFASVSLWVNGLAARVTNYSDIEQARAAAERLAEERGSALPEEPTTPGPVELVRKQLEALDRRDFDGVMSSVTEDTVFDGRALGDHFEGRAAIRGFVDDWFRAWKALDFELEEVSDLGGGVVFAVVIQDGRLVGGDGRIRQREGWVYLWVGGSLAGLAVYEVDEGRAAAERLAEERR
jgi:ketosteroid isomerase-like protein